MENLKSCPFCGNQAGMHVFSGHIWAISCSHCGAIITFRGHESLSACIQAFNKRTTSDDANQTIRYQPETVLADDMRGARAGKLLRADAVRF